MTSAWSSGGQTSTRSIPASSTPASPRTSARASREVRPPGTGVQGAARVELDPVQPDDAVGHVAQDGGALAGDVAPVAKAAEPGRGGGGGEAHARGAGARPRQARHAALRRVPAELDELEGAHAASAVAAAGCG